MESGLARTTDPLTSHLAAKSINITNREQDVLDALARITIGNAWDICDAIKGVRGTDEVSSNITPRIASLIRKGKIAPTGELKKKPDGKELSGLPARRRGSGRDGCRGSNRGRVHPVRMKDTYTGRFYSPNGENGISRNGQMPRLNTNWCPQCKAYTSQDHEHKGKK